MTEQIHPSATIGEGFEMGFNCIIGENVTVGSNVKIGNMCVIEANTVVGDDVSMPATAEKVWKALKKNKSKKAAA